MSTKSVGCRMCSGIGRITKHRHDPETAKLVPVGEVPCSFCGGSGRTQVPKDASDYAEDIRRLTLEIDALWAEVRSLRRSIKP